MANAAIPGRVLHADLVARISPRLRLGRSTSTFCSRATTTLWLFHTFFRATWATRRGPRPVRSLSEPRGLARLTTRERDRAILGNTFADFAFEVARVAFNSAKFFVMEQPEDLGAMPAGPHQGHRPATMWQWPQHGRRAGLLHWTLTETTAAAGRMVASKATDQWPTKMAEWLAQLTCATTATTAVPDREPSTQLAIHIDGEPNEDLGYIVNEPEGPRLLGGHGPPGDATARRWDKGLRRAMLCGWSFLGLATSSDSRHRRQASGLDYLLLSSWRCLGMVVGYRS